MARPPTADKNASVGTAAVQGTELRRTDAGRQGVAKSWRFLATSASGGPTGRAWMFPRALAPRAPTRPRRPRRPPARLRVRRRAGGRLPRRGRSQSSFPPPSARRRSGIAQRPSRSAPRRGAGACACGPKETALGEKVAPPDVRERGGEGEAGGAARHRERERERERDCGRGPASRALARSRSSCPRSCGASRGQVTGRAVRCASSSAPARTPAPPWWFTPRAAACASRSAGMKAPISIACGAASTAAFAVTGSTWKASSERRRGSPPTGSSGGAR